MIAHDLHVIFIKWRRFEHRSVPAFIKNETKKSTTSGFKEEAQTGIKDFESV